MKGSSGQELRRRLVLHESSSSSFSTPGTGLLDKVKQFDVYPKIKRSARGSEEDSHQLQTASGGIVSIVSFVVILWLSSVEISRYFSTQLVEHMKVDTSSVAPLNIEFDISFPSIPCPDLHLCSMDVTGEQHVNIIRQIYKQRLALDGHKIGEPYLDRPDVDDIRVIPGIGILRLRSPEAMAKLKNEGCNMKGNLRLTKVAGNFHIAVGKGLKYGSHHIHHFNMSDIEEFNASHIIHSLSFGPKVRVSEDLLDGEQFVLPNEGGVKYSSHVEYHIQLIPTTFINRLGWKFYTYRYSVTDEKTKIFPNSQGASQLPGLFFIYKFSPYMIEVKDEHPGFLEFLTSICAIIGGVVATAGILDSALFHLIEPQGILHAKSETLRRSSGYLG